MGSFFKKFFSFFNNESSTSSLLEKAMDHTIQNQGLQSSYVSGAFSNFFGGSSNSSYRDGEDEMNRLFQEQHMRDVQQMQEHQHMNDTFDPYQNPGQDIVVDESHHGIDHGTDHGFDDGGHHHDF